MIFSGIFFRFAFKIASSAIILVYAFIILQFARKRSQNNVLYNILGRLKIFFFGLDYLGSFLYNVKYILTSLVGIQKKTD